MFLATSDRIIILDPMGEYSPLVRQFGQDGLVVEIAPNSPHHINPMDLDVSIDDEVSPISLKCDFILVPDGADCGRQGRLTACGAHHH